MGGFQQRPWTPTKRRGPIAAEYSSPGPACVTLPSLLGKTAGDSKKGRAPAYSFGSRHGGKNDNLGPGPGQYNITGLSAKGKDNPPAASLHSRAKEGKCQKSPAPGDYNPEKSEKIIHDNAPKFTFGHKTQLDKPNNTPAPNVYKIPGVLGGTKEAYSVASRSQLPCEDRLKPGPGAYSPEKVSQISGAIESNLLEYVAKKNVFVSVFNSTVFVSTVPEFNSDSFGTI
ncbi:hypothetical protein AAG570_012928 [Ranatra chinensis]|uniref:Uncharacterized protein n=1 Tax=Ranatra chinensis TaxID=642074 RepID=A0ABD0YFF9_9HEMI